MTIKRITIEKLIILVDLSQKKHKLLKKTKKIISPNRFLINVRVLLFKVDQFLKKLTST